MPTFESPRTISELFIPGLGGMPAPEVVSNNQSDRADLITKVYTDMGVFSRAFAEQAPELLRANPAVLAVDSFVVVNLTPEYNLASLMAGYNKGQKNPTTRWEKLWDQYTLEDINRRTVPAQGGVEPTPGEVRVLNSTKSEFENAYFYNQYNEDGLAGTYKNMAEQQALIGSKVVLNLTDYVLLQKLRQEEGRKPMDDLTLTRFPQMEYKEVDGHPNVGDANWNAGRLYVRGSWGNRIVQDGFRFSDVASEQ